MPTFAQSSSQACTCTASPSPHHISQVRSLQFAHHRQFDCLLFFNREMWWGMVRIVTFITSRLISVWRHLRHDQSRRTTSRSISKLFIGHLHVRAMVQEDYLFFLISMDVTTLQVVHFTVSSNYAVSRTSVIKSRPQYVSYFPDRKSDYYCGIGTHVKTPHRPNVEYELKWYASSLEFLSPMLSFVV